MTTPIDECAMCWPAVAQPLAAVHPDSLAAHVLGAVISNA